MEQPRYPSEKRGRWTSAGEPAAYELGFANSAGLECKEFTEHFQRSGSERNWAALWKGERSEQIKKDIEYITPSLACLVEERLIAGFELEHDFQGPAAGSPLLISGSPATRPSPFHLSTLSTLEDHLSRPPHTLPTPASVAPLSRTISTLANPFKNAIDTPD
ncbi:hypothetical protein NMY22_g17419 [Coprinellus aureogranulatus]|nr:hypothetical protein NMY22_g17419 [Coprinellus aureogranulatus]